MSDLSQILSQIKPCTARKPYIFVSYSSSDRDTVWRDVLQFQQNGYNVWLDEKNLDKTKESWKDDALQAISSRHCQLLLFYVSATSLCSEPCLRELRETSAKKTTTNHNGPVPFVAVDVEPIGNIIRFCDRVHEQLSEIEDDDEFERKAQALVDFKEEFFNGNNDRVRVHPRHEEGRKGDYYEDIQNSFPDKTRLSPPDPPPGPGPDPDTKDLHTVKTLSPTDIKYNICTFGSAFHVGLGAPVTVEMAGTCYKQRMHNTTKGRVDGLKQLYADQGLRLGDTLEARYVAAENTIHLKRIQTPPNSTAGQLNE